MLELKLDEWRPKNPDLGYPKSMLQHGNRSLYSNRTQSYIKVLFKPAAGKPRQIDHSVGNSLLHSPLLSVDTIRLWVVEASDRLSNYISKYQSQGCQVRHGRWQEMAVKGTEGRTRQIVIGLWICNIPTSPQLFEFSTNPVQGSSLRQA